MTQPVGSYSFLLAISALVGYPLDTYAIETKWQYKWQDGPDRIGTFTSGWLRLK
jgi:hypothetical protein